MKMYRLMNHDSSHTSPKFEAYPVAEYNEQFGSDYASIEEAIGDDPEYLFTEEEMREYMMLEKNPPDT